MGGEGALYFIVCFVAGEDMESCRVHFKGKGVAGTVNAQRLHTLTCRIQCVDGIKVDAGLAVCYREGNYAVLNVRAGKFRRIVI